MEDTSANGQASRSAHITFDNGAGHVDILATPHVSELFEAELHAPEPAIEVDDEQVNVRYRRYARRRDSRPRDRFLLNSDRRWNLRITKGASNLTADLRTTEVESVEIGMASEVLLKLPRPTGEMRIRVLKSAKNISIRRPPGVPIRVRIGASSSRSRLDGDYFESIGGATSWQSTNFKNSGPRCVVEINGACAELHVTAE